MQQEAHTISSDFSESESRGAPTNVAWALVKRVTKPARAYILARQLEQEREQFERGKGIPLRSLEDLL